MIVLVDTRCAFVGIGRDFFSPDMPLVLCVWLIRRKAEIGEMRWRFVLGVRFHLARPIFLRTWPAWRDEPTALAEYERTMRGKP